jgi:hypothetical protein
MKPVYRKGKVHVKKRMCKTCIFRKGNLMRLSPGRVEEMVAATAQAQSCIPCHETLDRNQAVCAGFFKKHATQPLLVAERLGYVKLV